MPDELKSIEELTIEDFPPGYVAQRLIAQVRELSPDDQAKVRLELSLFEPVDPDDARSLIGEGIHTISGLEFMGYVLCKRRDNG